MAETDRERRTRLAYEKNKGDNSREKKVEQILEAPHPRESGVSDMSLFDKKAGFTDPRGQQYLKESGGRGLGLAGGGVFDFVNMLPNAALQSGYDIFTGHPENAPQFPNVGEAIQDWWAGDRDIVPEEEVTPGVRLAGAGAETLTSVAADPLNLLGLGAFSKAKQLSKAPETPLVERYPKPGRTEPEAPPSEPAAFSGADESRPARPGEKYMPSPADDYDPHAVRKPTREDLNEILKDTENKGSIPATAKTPEEPPVPVDEEGVIQYPEHERSGVFDYGAEYPERDLGTQRFVPKKVPERTEELLSRQDVKEKMAEGINRGRNFKDWYNTAPIRKVFEDEFGPERGLQLFDRWMDANSATSPRSDVGTNVRNASYWYGKTFREPGANTKALTLEDLPEKPPNPYGHLAQLLHRGNVAKTLLPGGSGYDFKSNAKPIAYGGNLKGDLSKAAIDAHAYKAPAILGADERFLERSFKPGKDEPTQNIQNMLERGEISMEDAINRPAWWQSRPRETEYDAFEKYWSELGSDFGMKPGEVQPSGWTGLGRTTGLESDPTKKYMDFTEERILKTARKYNMDPIDVFRLAIKGKMPLVEADVSDVPGYTTTG